MTKKKVKFSASSPQRQFYDPLQPATSISAKVAQLTGRKKSPSPKEQRLHKRKQTHPQRLQYPNFFAVLSDPEREEPGTESEEDLDAEFENKERINACSFFEEPQQCVYLTLYGTGPRPCDCGCNDGARECDCGLCHECMGPCENACSECGQNCFLGHNLPIGKRTLCDLCEYNFNS